LGAGSPSSVITDSSRVDGNPDGRGLAVVASDLALAQWELRQPEMAVFLAQGKAVQLS